MSGRIQLFLLNVLELSFKGTVEKEASYSYFL